MPVLVEQSTTDQRPKCCFEGFAINRAKYFLKGILEGRISDETPGEKERLLTNFGSTEDGPAHAEDMCANPLGWWLSKGSLQGIIDKEAGVLPGETERLELLLQADPEIIVLWFENQITLKKQHRTDCDKLPSGDEFSDNKHSEGNSRLASDKISGDTDQDSESSEESYENNVSMNELYQFGQLRSLAIHLNRYHPDMSETEFNMTTAEARVRGEFKRIKAALEYLQKTQDISSNIKSFNKNTMEFAELACKFLKQVVEMYADDTEAEVSEHIFTSFFKEFAALYPSPEESRGRAAEEIEYQKQFVIAFAKALGSVMSESDDE